jgi:hypothetical protein
MCVFMVSCADSLLPDSRRMTTGLSISEAFDCDISLQIQSKTPSVPSPGGPVKDMHNYLFATLSALFFCYA